MSTLWNDIKYGLRKLGRSPGFTAVAVIVLALGIGANTAMFSLVNALLLRPLAVDRPADLIGVYSKDRKPEGGYRTFSYPNYVDLRDRNAEFSSLLAFTISMVGLNEGDVTHRAFVAEASANYFSTFGIRPALGRAFSAEEERPGSAIPVAIVSYTWWQHHGANPGVLGTPLVLNGRSFTIIGVAPKYFTGTTALFSPEVWVPLGNHELLANDFMSSSGKGLSDRGNHCLFLVGRLKTGVTAAAAEARLARLASQLEEAYPAENKDQTLVLSPLPRLSISTNPQNNGELKALSVMLLPMSAVVLLIACLNLANMLLARGAARTREFAVRLALGGGRGHIIRQLLTEAAIVSLVGAVAGLIVACWATKALSASLGARLPFMTLVLSTAPDARVLAATLGFSVLATLVFALGPAWRMSRVQVVEDLKEQAGLRRGTHRGHGLLAPRNLLVTAQIALSLVLLTIAGLFVRGAHKAAKADPGFRFEQGLLAEIDASLAGYDETKGRVLYREVLDRVRALPGVEAASLASMVPFGTFSDGREVQKAGGDPNGSGPAGQGKSHWADYVIVGTDYFRALGLPLLRGREFDRVEVEGSGARVAIVDETLAKAIWANDDPLGRQIQFVEHDPKKEPVVMLVVGVVPGLRNELTAKEPSAHVYVPFGQKYQAMMNLHVRLTRGDAAAEAAMLRAVRTAIREVDDRLPVLSVNTLRDFRSEGLMMWFVQAGARLFSVFAAVALFLAVVGVYGVKAFVVARRTREIGIRVALGATMFQVLWMVLRDGLRLTAVGLAVGLLLSLATGRLVSSKLYEVSGSDPLTFVTASAVLAAAALVACALPARRAAKIDPMEALRCE
jgi:predicted permease